MPLYDEHYSHLWMSQWDNEIHLTVSHTHICIHMYCKQFILRASWAPSKSNIEIASAWFSPKALRFLWVVVYARPYSFIHSNHRIRHPKKQPFNGPYMYILLHDVDKNEWLWAIVILRFIYYTQCRPEKP